MIIKGKLISLQLLIIIILAGGLYFTIARVRSLKDKVAEQDVQITLKEAEKEGFRALLETKNTQTIVPHLPPPPTSKNPLKQPEIAARLVTETVLVEVPCQPQVSPNEDTLSIPSTPLNISGDVELRIDLIDDKLLYKGVMFVNLHNSTFNNITELNIDKENSAFTISPQLNKIIKKGLDHPRKFAIIPRPLKHTRMGWAVGIDPICSVQDSRVCPAIVYGVQF